ncbi:efflux RND transporter periplasmic adaptor subunit [Paracoccus denitrificans]|jgi:macrolide-specific efflux system membrane fusion protein|uniref:Efflux transporter, RND family, MFP subunit n=1 Tax=Paracoccus denitrificans (strain Pd 1222) TaxID=318586 RepID=A1B7M2_PARDP|nr:efflux RND transporter periplasmic adaptor subunit [Paracoccus denitrificans]ABL71516.1 efflux transporter, RND family, MFP subunit [Paracoccus denitrificans PD1222]QAR28117.1 efflux RND transporter periplasmic adaptor subunit [Paracoccus denitrificans]UFS67468.1 efflux RND transporter periplasmic adaptor subunit [Paracoccus denitrificans]UPV97844.1 efflux RND transporter periplasmic adaptor subunit [Paracoccus denitrificans]WQO35759.1 efflux RND transporter periplasmic adaptor subunit [Par
MRKTMPVALILGALLIAVAVLRWPGATPGGAAAPGYLTAPAERGSLEVSVLAEGRLKPSNLVAVGAQVSGRITELAVVLGQRVEQGDLIARIDSVQQANELRTAQAALANLKAQMAERRAVLALAEKTLERQQNLIRSNAASRSTMDSAQQDVDVARAQIAALQAQIAQAEVAIEIARTDLDYTRITAPMAGTVLAIVSQAGQTVNAVQSSPTIVVLGQLDRMDVHAEISEADIGKVRPGQKVRFSLLDDSGRSYEGVLDSIAPAPQSIVNDSAIQGGTGTDSSSGAIYYTGIVPVENPDGRLRSYMTAQVSIVLGAAQDVLTIPSSALGRRNPDGSHQVRVLGGAGIETRDVVIGLNDKVAAEVVSGLAEGERVVTGEQGAAPAAAAPRGSRRMMGPLGG